MLLFFNLTFFFQNKKMFQRKNSFANSLKPSHLCLKLAPAPPSIKPFLDNEYAWDLYSWGSVNSFLRNRVATLSREELLNGQAPHLFFIKTSIDDT